MTLRVLVWCAVSSKAQTAHEKMSLPDQEARGKAWAESNGHQLIDTLIVSGHSRRYTSLRDVSIAAMRRGIDAFAKLEKYLEACDFDVLWVRDADRIGRTQALVAEITERLINCGARIYSDSDGWIDSQNFRMWIAMAGYKAAASVDGFVKTRLATMEELARQGMKPSGRPPLSHHYVYDPHTGERTGMVVRDDMRPIFADLAKLLRAGVAMSQLEIELYKQYGHVDPDTGQPFKRSTLYYTLLAPGLWGHIVFAPGERSFGVRYGHWSYDRSLEPPASVRLYYDMVEAMYQGEVAEQVMDELRRRREIIKGRASPTRTHKFTGLFVCGCCFSRMETYSQKHRRIEGKYYYHLTCSTRRYANPPCPNPQMLSYLKAQVQLDAILQTLADQPSFDAAFGDTDSSASYETEIDQLNQVAARLNREIDRLLEAQAAGADATSLYQKKINERAAQLKETEQRIRELGSIRESKLKNERVRLDTLAGIREMGYEQFWEQDGRTINQALFNVLGDYRLVILEGEITDYYLPPKRLKSRR